MTDLWTVKDVANFLGIKPVTVYSWVKQRHIPHIVLKTNPRKDVYRFDQDTVKAWIRGRVREGQTLAKWDTR